MKAVPDTHETASATAQITHDPERLAALCEMWKAEHKSVWLTLAGYSMAPSLLPKTRLKIECGCEPASLREGDILAFRREGRLVVHRLFAITGGEPVRYVCKGDGNDQCDEPVEAAAIVGRVVETRPPAFLTLLRKRIGHLLVRYRRRRAQAASREVVS